MTTHCYNYYSTLHSQQNKKLSMHLVEGRKKQARRANSYKFAAPLQDVMYLAERASILPSATQRGVDMIDVETTISTQQSAREPTSTNLTPKTSLQCQ